MTKEAENAVQIFNAVRWISSLPSTDGIPLVTPELREQLAAMAEHYTESLEAVNQLRKQLTKRGRKPANGVAQTGTERSEASRARKAKIEAPLRAEITGLKAQIAALRAEIKARK